MNEVEAIKNKKDIEKIKKAFNNKRDLMLFVLGVNVGLRISDLLNLKVDDVLDKKSVIIIVCDTDVVTDAHKKRFVSNINKLAKLTNNKIHILVHKLNFEDELAYAALYKDKTLLYKAYKVEGEKDFKKKFAQSRNIRKGLEALHIELDKL